MGYPVWLVRFVKVGSTGQFGKGHYRRAVELPIPPFLQLGVGLNGCTTDPWLIQEVKVTQRGCVICELDDITYHDSDFKNEDEDCGGEEMLYFSTYEWEKYPDHEDNWLPPTADEIRAFAARQHVPREDRLAVSE